MGGIVGVVVLIKDGSDPATDDAASAMLEALRSGGLNAAKGNWPADWRRFRGTLYGPQSPGPTVRGYPDRRRRKGTLKPPSGVAIAGPP